MKLLPRTRLDQGNAEKWAGLPSSARACRCCIGGSPWPTRTGRTAYARSRFTPADLARRPLAETALRQMNKHRQDETLIDRLTRANAERVSQEERSRAAFTSGAIEAIRSGTAPTAGPAPDIRARLEQGNAKKLAGEAHARSRFTPAEFAIRRKEQ